MFKRPTYRTSISDNVEPTPVSEFHRIMGCIGNTKYTVQRHIFLLITDAFIYSNKIFLKKPTQSSAENVTSDLQFEDLGY